MKIKKSIIFTLIITGFSFNVYSIEVAQGVGISGYLDASYSQVKTDNNKSDKSFQIDTLDVMVEYHWEDKLKFETHIVGGNNKDTEIEQAYIDYKVTENINVNVGKFLSIQGFEAYHAPDLYQYSTSATLVYPGMMNAVSVSYHNELVTIYGAVMASAWDSKDSNFNDAAYEAAIKLRPFEGINFHTGYVSEDMVNGLTRTLTNIWGSYQFSNFIIAAEYNNFSSWKTESDNGNGQLLMLNYKVSDKWALTLRTSKRTLENSGSQIEEDINKWTISPSYSLEDNWLLVFEYNEQKDRVLNITSKTLALESILTF